MHAILRQLRRAALLSAGDGPSDVQLLESFLIQRDEAAFEALVRRHGPMVLGVCRRVTGNAHDAEDAFQATFLVLVRKAASLRSRQLLPGWLYGVAYRTALNTRTMTKKRRIKEQQAAQQPWTQVSNDGPPEELLARLDEELSRLPDRYRLPVLLCELQGRSRKEAARLLGLPIGTVSWRLAQARKLLAQRLARYGTMLAAGAVGAVLSQSAASAVPAALVRAVTVQALMTGTVPAPVQALTEGVLKTMLLSKLKVMWGLALAAIVGAGAVGLMYRPAVAADPNQPGGGRTAARPSQDELEELRLEIAALRKGLQATRERVKTLEDQLARLPASRPGMPGRGTPTVGYPVGNQTGSISSSGVGVGSNGSVTGTVSYSGMGTTGARTQSTSNAGTGTAYSGTTTSQASSGGGNITATTTRHPQNGSMSHSATGLGTGSMPSSAAALMKAGTQRMHSRETSTSAGTHITRPENLSLTGTRTESSSETKLEAKRRDAYDAIYRAAKDAIEQGLDPVDVAQAALKQLRKHPNDSQAADRLERALQRLARQRQR